MDEYNDEERARRARLLVRAIFGASSRGPGKVARTEGNSEGSSDSPASNLLLDLPIDAMRVVLTANDMCRQKPNTVSLDDLLAGRNVHSAFERTSFLPPRAISKKVDEKIAVASPKRGIQPNHDVPTCDPDHAPSMHESTNWKPCAKTNIECVPVTIDYVLSSLPYIQSHDGLLSAESMATYHRLWSKEADHVKKSLMSWLCVKSNGIVDMALVGKVDDANAPWENLDVALLKQIAQVIRINTSIEFLKIQGREYSVTTNAAERNVFAFDDEGNEHLIRGIHTLWFSRNESQKLTNLKYDLPIMAQEFEQCLTNALNINASLTSLDVSFNNISSEAALSLVSIFEEKGQMQSVGLRRCNLGIDGAKAVADYVSVSASLTSLDIGNNNIGDEGATAMAGALRINASLTSLILDVNDVGAEGAKALADALRVNASLTSLNLVGNGVGAKGAEAIADALRVNASLTSLDLGGNGVGAEGAKAIADALRVNASLTSLLLGANRIDDEGATAIGDALHVNDSLTSLDLRQNDVGAEGAKAIADALRVNASLTKLDVRFNNGIDGKAKAALREVVKGPMPWDW